MRQTEGSVVCTNCGRLVDVDEKNCPYCGQWRPGLFGYASGLRSTFGNMDVTHILIYTCTFLFLASLVADVKGAFSAPAGLFSFLSPSPRALALLGRTGADMPWTTQFSATLLHGSALHIFFNMMWIRSMGSFIEEEFGAARYFTIFVLSGFGGFVLSNQLSGAPTIGASGAVFGLLGAAIVFGRHRGGSIGQAVTQQAWGYAIAIFVMGFLMRGINNYAHAGGFLAGYLVATLQVRRLQRPESPMEQLLAIALAVMSLLAIVLAIIHIAPHIYRI